MAEHSPDQVVPIAAMLLAGRFDAEPHHVKRAVATANALLDEAFGIEDPVNEEPEPEVEPAPAAEPAAE